MTEEEGFILAILFILSKWLFLVAAGRAVLFVVEFLYPRGIRWLRLAERSQSEAKMFSRKTRLVRALAVTSASVLPPAPSTNVGPLKRAFFNSS
jgi:hypothetical protein